MDPEKKMLMARVLDMSEDELRVAMLSMLSGVSLRQAIDRAFHPIKKAKE